MKGILLAGGNGTRLFPATSAICKQLLPIYDKPMIYYPLSVLMLAGIREILIISTPVDTPILKSLFGDGSQYGLKLSYQVQKRPEGLAQAFILAESFIGKDPVALILGDNIFHGHGFIDDLERCVSLQEGGMIFGYRVKNPNRYGVVVFDDDHHVIGIEEKPENPRSSYAVPGLYFYDHHVVSIAKSLKPSKRGELEITDVNMAYLKEKKLKIHLLGRGYAWLDTGTFDSYQKASSFVQAIQERQGIQIACIEEVAYRKGFISLEKLESLTSRYPNNDYGDYLKQLVLNEKAMNNVLLV